MVPFLVQFATRIHEPMENRLTCGDSEDVPAHFQAARETRAAPEPNEKTTDYD
jgi:hypothetical protein